MVANFTYLHKDTACSFEEILETVPYKTALYGHLPPISKTIQIRLTKHFGQCWSSKDELISNVHLLNLTHEHTCVGREAKIYYGRWRRMARGRESRESVLSARLITMMMMMIWNRRFNLCTISNIWQNLNKLRDRQTDTERAREATQ